MGYHNNATEEKEKDEESKGNEIDKIYLEEKILTGYSNNTTTNNNNTDQGQGKVRNNNNLQNLLISIHKCLPSNSLSSVSMVMDAMNAMDSTANIAAYSLDDVNRLATFLQEQIKRNMNIEDNESTSTIE